MGLDMQELTKEKPVMARTIDLTPTWGEWGNMYRMFAESGERKACKALYEDFAKAMAACEALSELRKSGTLTDEQAGIIARTLAAELTVQGF